MTDLIYGDVLNLFRYRRVQNWSKGRYKATALSGHKEIVWSVLTDRDRIISGSEDMTIKVWETDSGMCLNTLKGHKNGTVSNIPSPPPFSPFLYQC
jgi:WD40 repeat protein